MCRPYTTHTNNEYNIHSLKDAQKHKMIHQQYGGYDEDSLAYTFRFEFQTHFIASLVVMVAVLE